MTAAQELGLREKALAEKLLAMMPPPEGVESSRVELGEDPDGEPAMWVVFTLGRNRIVDAQWIDHFSRYSTHVSLKILESGVERFPYTRIERAA